jgi:ketosteroid isomerase-like protein
MAASEQFANSGGKLTRLEFPKTEIQCYGNTAILYSLYLYEIEQNGQHTLNSGRVTEVFVRRNGQWVNPAWHMDSTK